jgi:hypothetical protein
MAADCDGDDHKSAAETAGHCERRRADAKLLPGFAQIGRHSSCIEPDRRAISLNLQTIFETKPIRFANRRQQTVGSLQIENPALPE